MTTLSVAAMERTRTTDVAPLMLVSASADAELRREVADGVRPRPEYLILEADHGFRLLDWSQLPLNVTRRGRSAFTSAVQVTSALPLLRATNAVLSDGEHLGIPLSLAMQAQGRRTPHVVIGHHLNTSSKRLLLRRLRASRAMDRVLVHSVRQQEVATDGLHLATDQIAVLPYAVDTDFWAPGAEGAPGAPTIASAGIEHRDYQTLVEAASGLDARLVISVGSAHSPQSQARLPERWPASAEVGFAPAIQLRRRYAEAAIVSVPVVETDFPAGITTILEAMAMGKPVVVSETLGIRGIVRDGETGLLVPPGDPAAMHRALRCLLENGPLRRRLGAQARAFAVAEAGVERFAERLAAHVRDAAATTRRGASRAPARSSRWS